MMLLPLEILLVSYFVIAAAYDFNQNNGNAKHSNIIVNLPDNDGELCIGCNVENDSEEELTLQGNQLEPYSEPQVTSFLHGGQSELGNSLEGNNFEQFKQSILTLFKMEHMESLRHMGYPKGAEVADSGENSSEEGKQFPVSSSSSQPSPQPLPPPPPRTPLPSSSSPPPSSSSSSSPSSEPSPSPPPPPSSSSSSPSSEPSSEPSPSSSPSPLSTTTPTPLTLCLSPPPSLSSSSTLDASVPRLIPLTCISHFN